MAAAVVLGGMALGATAVLLQATGVCLAILPLATGPAILRYRLYDLDRIISRTLAYGLLTVLLGGGYAAIVLGSGSCLVDARAWRWRPRRWPGRPSRLAAASSRLSTGASTGAATTAPTRSSGFSARLCQQIDLDTLTAELGVVEQTMQPTTVSLWLRPSRRASQDQTMTDASHAAR